MSFDGVLFELAELQRRLDEFSAAETARHGEVMGALGEILDRLSPVKG